MEAAKLDEVYRCGFIGEEEYLRRFALLNVHGTVACLDPAAAPASATARSEEAQAQTTPYPTLRQHHGAMHNPTSTEMIPTFTATTPALEQRGGDPWLTADDEAEQELNNVTAPSATRPNCVVETPSWRLIDEDDDGGTCEEYTDDDDEDEDTDDEAYARRHKPYERGEVATSLLYMTVIELRGMLRDHGLPTSGNKSDLAVRLATHVYMP